MEILNQLKRGLGLKKTPTPDEVIKALDQERWRTRFKVIELINQSRTNEERFNLETWMGYYANKVLQILRDLEREGLVESKNDNELSFTEMGAADDARVMSPQAIQRKRVDRGMRPQRVYRLASGGIRDKEGHEIEYSTGEIAALQAA